MERRDPSPRAAPAGRTPPGPRGIPSGGEDALLRMEDVTGRSISEKEFNAFRELIHRLSGISLSPEKKVLLVGRLSKRLRALGLASFGEYLRFIREEDGGGETVCMLNCICTNETHFFREPQQFEFLEKSVYPEWESLAASGRRSRHIRAWSAACSTGEEPYSLAMSLLSRFPPSAGWTVDILATDLSTAALDRAVGGIWSADGAGDIPRAHLTRFMLKGTGGRAGTMAAGPELRAVIRFRRFNLAGEEYPGEKDFDLILCRNVIIYFDAPTKLRVVGRLLDHLAPDGYIFLGHAENLHGLEGRVRRHLPAVYSLAPAAGRREAR